jgi:hypothetical protein
MEKRRAVRRLGLRRDGPTRARHLDRPRRHRVRCGAAGARLRSAAGDSGPAPLAGELVACRESRATILATMRMSRERGACLPVGGPAANRGRHLRARGHRHPPRAPGPAERCAADREGEAPELRSGVSAAHGGDRGARNAGEADADVGPPRDPRRRLGAEVPARAAAPEPRRSDARRVARGMGIGCLRILREWATARAAAERGASSRGRTCAERTTCARFGRLLGGFCLR